MNKERYAPVFSIKYTETVQSMKKIKNDMISTARSAAREGKRRWSNEENIRPPSKLPAGKRLRRARKSEATINKTECRDFAPKQIYTKPDDKKFAKGPQKASAASFQ